MIIVFEVGFVQEVERALLSSEKQIQTRWQLCTVGQRFLFPFFAEILFTIFLNQTLNKWPLFSKREKC